MLLEKLTQTSTGLNEEGYHASSNRIPRPRPLHRGDLPGGVSRSIELFFPRKPRERLLRLLALSFALLFGRGAKGAVALDEDGRMAGYLLYSTSKGQARGSLPQAVSLLARMALGLGPVEMLKLMTNQLLMMITVRKAKKYPNPRPPFSRWPYSLHTRDRVWVLCFWTMPSRSCRASPWD